MWEARITRSRHWTARKRWFPAGPLPPARGGCETQGQWRGRYQRVGMNSFEGRIALVTGAGSAEGIGFATARILAERGARVAITSTTKRIFDRLEELPGGPRDKAAFVFDLMKPKAADTLVARATRALGRIDILVNNAGMTQVGQDEAASRFDRMPDEELETAIE